MASSTELMAEDRRIVEAVQENMAGGRFERGVLSPRHEGGLAAFQRIVRAALES
jgi:choline monooxygenase